MNVHYILYDKQVIPKQQVTFSPIITGLLRGEGVFTTLLVRDGKPIFFEEHCQRLYIQAKELHFQITEVRLESIYELILCNAAQKGDYRLKICYIARGDFFQKEKASILLGILSPYIQVYRPLRLLPYPHPIQTPLSSYKTIGYSHRFFLLEWAKTHQFDDVITMDAKGYILETALANIFWIKHKIFYYPALDLPLFPGITLKIIKKIISSWEGYTIEKSYKKIEDIDASAQWFLCNSLLGVRPIIQIGSIAMIRDYILEQQLDNALKNIGATPQKLEHV